MPDPAAELRSIRSRIYSRLVEPHPEIKWILREDYGRMAEPTGNHVIIDIVPARSVMAAMGNPRLFRTRGALVFRIATPLDAGSGPNLEIASFIIPEFRCLLDTEVDPPVRYYTPTWTRSELPDETTWFVGRVSVDWTVDFNEEV